jgi:hypothetical protein
MTLRLPKNRRTIQPYPKTAKTDNLLHLTRRNLARCFIGIVGLTILVGYSATKAEAADSHIRQVNYTHGNSGNQLAWLPYRPVEGAVDHGDRPESRVRTAAADSPIQDPFGDQLLGERPEAKPRRSIVKKASIKKYANQLSDSNRELDSFTSASSREKLPLLAANDPKPTGFNATGKTPSVTAKEANTSETIEDFSPEPVLALPPGIKRPAMPPGMNQSDKGTKVAVPLLEQQWADSIVRDDECPEKPDLKPISEVTNDIKASEGPLPHRCPLKEDEYHTRDWDCTVFTWKASGSCHKPLYFDENSLERYGHSWGPYIQPVISQAHFFVTVPLMPYKMGVEPPRECLYSLGYYRPGSCAPHKLDPLPLSIRAAVSQTAAVLGGVYLMP